MVSSGDYYVVGQAHRASDVDNSPVAQHHTLGYGANQAAPGNHVHDGTSSKFTPMQGVFKKVDHIVANSAVLEDDPEMQLDFEEVGYYNVSFFGIAWCGVLGADIQLAWAGRSGLALASPSNRFCLGPSVATTDLSNTLMQSHTWLGWIGNAYGCDANIDPTYNTVIHEELMLNVTAPGKLVLQVAQNVANANPTYLYGGSFAYWRKFLTPHN